MPLLCCSYQLQRHNISLQWIFPFFSPPKKKKKEKNKIFYLFAIDFSIFFSKKKEKMKKKKKDILSLVCWRVGVCIRVSSHLQDIIFI